jgi:pantoate--beta-alanine ligase
MLILEAPADVRAWRDKAAAPIGLVPTMGYLHEGHLSLVRAAKAENGLTVVSIFVNPTQFGANEDLSKYPRDFERDRALLEEAGVDLLFAPRPEDMYPAGYDSWVETRGLTGVLEGRSRPTHFRGVTTVVAKLFNVVRPERAYFGKKDAQQLRVIQKMVRDLDMAVDVVPVPTVREPDGLAMSSRNKYLDERQRQAASCLFRGLQRAEAAWRRGERDADAIREHVLAEIAEEPLARVDYVSLADDASLRELDDGPASAPALLSLAVFVGKTRLIDNIELT